MAWRGSTTVQDRIFASLPYLLPIISALPFGSFLFRQFPALEIILLPLQPVLFIYSSLGSFAGIIVFFLLFLLVVRNERIIHFIRFNTMQAILIDIALVLCSLVTQYILTPLGTNLLTETLINVVFLAAIGACGYSIFQSLFGRYAEIPGLSEAVYAQVR
ncbi:MAG TPA: Tic20 family protein [Cyanophyceae cyanobacterium]